MWFSKINIIFNFLTLESRIQHWNFTLKTISPLWTEFKMHIFYGQMFVCSLKNQINEKKGFWRVNAARQNVLYKSSIIMSPHNFLLHACAQLLCICVSFASKISFALRAKTHTHTLTYISNRSTGRKNRPVGGHFLYAVVRVQSSVHHGWHLALMHWKSRAPRVYIY